MLATPLAGPERSQDKFVSRRRANENLDGAVDDDIDRVAAIALGKKQFAWSNENSWARLASFSRKSVERFARSAACRRRSAISVTEMFSRMN